MALLYKKCQERLDVDQLTTASTSSKGFTKTTALINLIVSWWETVNEKNSCNETKNRFWTRLNKLQNVDDIGTRLVKREKQITNLKRLWVWLNPAIGYSSYSTVSLSAMWKSLFSSNETSKLQSQLPRYYISFLFLLDHCYRILHCQPLYSRPRH